MAEQRVLCRGILVVCQCGNRFLVPQGQAGHRVPCTLCGGSLLVPESRSVQQAAALEGNGSNRSWEEVVALERNAPAAARKRMLRPPADPPAEPADPVSRRRIGRLVAAVLTLAVVGTAGAAVYRYGGSFADWSRNVHTSKPGGFQVRLPSGLTAKYFRETRGTRPPVTFEGVSFADGTCAGVAYIDLWDDSPLSELPEAVMCYLQREYHGDVSVADQCEIRLGRHPGRQVTYQSAGSAQQESYSRWFLVGNRLYDVAWIAGYSQPSISEVQEFLDSFRLLGEPDAQVTASAPSNADARTSAR